MSPAGSLPHAVDRRDPEQRERGERGARHQQIALRPSHHGLGEPEQTRQHIGQHRRADAVAKFPRHHPIPESDAVGLLEQLEILVRMVQAREPDNGGEPQQERERQHGEQRPVGQESGQTLEDRRALVDDHMHGKRGEGLRAGTIDPRGTAVGVATDFVSLKATKS